jgi:hypothetical protein
MAEKKTRRSRAIPNDIKAAKAFARWIEQTSDERAKRAAVKYLCDRYLGWRWVWDHL